MKKHILLIDKDKADLTLFMKAFDELDTQCKCTYTDCSDHASQMLEHLSPDCIFVHLDPEVGQNLEFLRTIKKQKRLRKIPVVVFSAKMPYYNFLARGYGADLCMLKPHETEQIKKSLGSLLFSGD